MANVSPSQTLDWNPHVNEELALDAGNQPSEADPDAPISDSAMPLVGRLGDPIAKLGDIAAAAGIRRVDMFAWRDLGHPEAGGSEVHAARIAERWAAAGVEVHMIASRAEGSLPGETQNGYQIHRPAGRYAIFPAVAAQRLARAAGARIGRRPIDSSGRRRWAETQADATVEIWNGMPFFSPLWAPPRRLVFLHHVHDRMWDLVLPPKLAAAGRFIEKRLAPPVYRRTPVVTLSDSSRQAIVAQLGLRPDRVHVVQPGVDDVMGPGSARAPHPLVAAVGRLVPYKRFDRLIEVLVRLKPRHPDLTAVIAGEGAERPALEALIRAHGAEDWITLPGRIDDDALVELYQRAWTLASPSAYEGWGLTITEAAACGTPSVVSPISGHVDAVAHGITGFLAEPGPDMEARLHDILSDSLLLRRMQKAARQRAEELSWDRTALETMRILSTSE